MPKLSAATDRFFAFFGVEPSTALKAALVALDRIKDNRARQQATESVALISRHYKEAVREALEPVVDDTVEQMRDRVKDALMDGDSEILLAIAVANDRDGSLAKTAEEGGGPG